MKNNLSQATAFFSFCLLTVAVSGWIHFSTPQPVQAQSELIYNSQTAADEIRQLKTRYRSEIEEYQQAEKQYQVAQTQYEQLQTLNALENAVRTTQLAMQARGKVLWTYLQLIKVTLNDQPGIHVEYKEISLDNLNELQEQLEAHQAKLEPELSKDQIITLAAEFTPMYTTLEDSAYQGLSLIEIGRLQTIYDKTKVLSEDMRSELATAGGALKASQRERAFNEVDQHLANVELAFDDVESSFDDPTYQGYRGVHRRIQDNLAEIYSNLTRVRSFLAEIISL